MERIVSRISNPYLKDGVDRVGRAPLRKLSRKERFIGPAYQLAEMGQPVDALMKSVEYACKFSLLSVPFRILTACSPISERRG